MIRNDQKYKMIWNDRIMVIFKWSMRGPFCSFFYWMQKAVLLLNMARNGLFCMVLVLLRPDFFRLFSESHPVVVFHHKHQQIQFVARHSLGRKDFHFLVKLFYGVGHDHWMNRKYFRELAFFLWFCIWKLICVRSSDMKIWIFEDFLNLIWNEVLDLVYKIK